MLRNVWGMFHNQVITNGFVVKTYIGGNIRVGPRCRQNFK